MRGSRRACTRAEVMGEVKATLGSILPDVSKPDAVHKDGQPVRPQRRKTSRRSRDQPCLSETGRAEKLSSREKSSLCKILFSVVKGPYAAVVERRLQNFIF